MDAIMAQPMDVSIGTGAREVISDHVEGKP